MAQELSLPPEALFLSKGDVGTAFEQAALAIMRRSMPYMGGTKIDNQPEQSVAEGLGKKLGVALEPDNLFFAHGAEQSFHFTARLIDAYVKIIRMLIEQRGEEAPDIVMLFRTPAHSPVIKQFEGMSFKCEMVSTYDWTDMWEHGAYTINNFIDNLHHAVTPRPMLPFENQSGRFVIGLFDANPSLSTGHVRTEEESIFIAEILAEARKRNAEFMASLVGAENAQKLREMFFLVEDLTLRGLEYSGEEAFSYASLSECAAITHAVFGVSEYGLSGMQGSVSVVPVGDTPFLRKMFDENQTALSPLSVFSCEYMFGTNPEDREVRERFLGNRAALWGQSAAIAYAIINGGAEEVLLPEEYETAQQWLQIYRAMPEPEAQKLLKEGIPGLRAMHMPEAGYYLFVDYEPLIKFHADETNWDTTQVKEVISNLAHDETGMAIGNGADMGLEDSDPAFRMNVDLPPDQLIDRLFRLRRLTEAAEAHGPVLTVFGKGRSLAGPAKQLRLTRE